MQNSKHRLRNDIILIAAVLLIAAIGLSAYLLLSSEGERAVITLDGEHYADYPLKEDITVTISSKEGLGTNILVISDGKAYVSEASCPDLICVKHRPIWREGEAIVCLPNKVVVSIE